MLNDSNINTSLTSTSSLSSSISTSSTSELSLQVEPQVELQVEPFRVIMVPRPHHEIELVCSRIQHMILNNKSKSVPCDIAVLARNGQILPLIKKRLRELGVLSVILGESSSSSSCDSNGEDSQFSLSAHKFLKLKVIARVLPFLKLLVDERYRHIYCLLEFEFEFSRVMIVFVCLYLYAWICESVCFISHLFLFFFSF